jgi:hypothetical protein
VPRDKARAYLIDLAGKKTGGWCPVGRKIAVGQKFDLRHPHCAPAEKFGGQRGHLQGRMKNQTHFAHGKPAAFDCKELFCDARHSASVTAALVWRIQHTREGSMARLVRATRRFFRRNKTGCSGIEFCAFGL